MKKTIFFLIFVIFIALGGNQLLAVGVNEAGQEVSFDWAFHTFILWVPGGSVAIDNYNSGTRTIYTSAGTLPKSTIVINKNGTYIWNSAWDKKILNGNWRTDNDGNIQILQGQEGKTWTLEKSKNKGHYTM